MNFFLLAGEIREKVLADGYLSGRRPHRVWQTVHIVYKNTQGGFFMKRMICVFLLALLAATAFAQRSVSTNRMAAGLDLFPLFGGIIYTDIDDDNGLFALSPSFEYLLIPHFSVGGILDLWVGNHAGNSIFYFGLTAHGRWYSGQALEGFFFDTGLGLNAFSYDGEATTSKYGGFFGINASLKTGYRLVFNGIIFVEPSIAYVYSKSSRFVSVTPLGWQPGLIVGGTF
jgi:hypothetical protein